MTSYTEELKQKNKIKLLEPFKGAKQHHEMECMVCTHVWKATPVSKKQTFRKYGVGGCPTCTAKLKKSKVLAAQQVVLDDLKSKGVVLLSSFSGTLQSTTKKLKFKNLNCGHTFVSAPGNVINRGVTCPECGKRERTAIINKWSKNNSEKWRETATEWQIYKSMVTSHTERTYKQNEQIINPENLPRGLAGEDGKYHLDHIVPKRFCFENNIPPEICADASNLQMMGWRENVGSRNNLKGTVPPMFMQYIDTSDRMGTYITTFQKHNPLFISYHMINGITATLYDRLNKIAILILPLSKSHADQRTGIDTLKQWDGIGIHYFIIFEDELVNMELILNKIDHYTHKSVATRIHARKCTIDKISATDKRDMLNAFHIQGNDNAQISYGAYHTGELVAVMTFTIPRFTPGHKMNNVWEMSRFATHTDYAIPGIASKLLTHFQRNNDWNKIISYVDRRWSSGNMYDAIGFKISGINPPTYYYVVSGKRKHRWGYQKSKLKTTLSTFNDDLTEYQNMQHVGFWRVWDCGTLRYEIKQTYLEP